MVLSSTDRYPRFRMTTITYCKVENEVGMDLQVDIRVDIRVYTRVDMVGSAVEMDMVDSAAGMAESSHLSTTQGIRGVRPRSLWPCVRAR